MGNDGSFTPNSTIVEVTNWCATKYSDAEQTGNLMPVRKEIQDLCHEMTLACPIEVVQPEY